MSCTLLSPSSSSPLTESNIVELERFVYDAGVAESRDCFIETFDKELPLSLFIRALVELNHAGAQTASAEFVNARSLDSRQIRFV